MKNLLFFLLAGLLLSSCTVTRQRCNELYPPVTYHTSDTVLQVREIILYDTTYIAADNSEVAVSFVSDGDSVKIVNSETTNGQRSSIKYRTERNSRVLKAVFNCKCDSLAIYHVFKDLDTSLSVNNTDVQIHTVEALRALTWWQQFKIDYGGYAMGLLLLYVLLRVGWWALRTYTSIQFPAAGIISKFL